MPFRRASQVRARKLILGGVLPKVLNAIVEALPEGGNEPLIIEGTAPVDEGTPTTYVEFTPSAGSPTQSQAVAAFRAGTPVILRVHYHDELSGDDYTSDALVISLSVYVELCGFIVDSVPRQIPIRW